MFDINSINKTKVHHYIPDDILRVYNVGDKKYVEKVNYLLNLDVDSGWEYEYYKKFE